MAEELKKEIAGKKKTENQANREKTNMEILVEIRNQRNGELKEQSNTSVSVVMVEFLGQGEQTGERIFRLFEQQEYEDKPIQVFEKYYMYKDDTPVLIGVKNPETGEILPVGMQGDKNEFWDIIKQDIDKCIEDRQKEYEEELKMMAKELGIKEEDIADLSIEELSRMVAEKENEQLRENTEEENVEELSEEEIKNIGGVSNEINLDVVVDGRGTELRDVLKLEEYVSIIPVPSYKLPGLNEQGENGENGENPRVPFALVGKRQDGSITTLPTNRIRLYRGGNTESTKINDTDSVEHSNKEESMFEIVGTNKRLIVNQPDGDYGRPNVYLGKATRTNDGNVAQKLQDRYAGTEETNIEVRQLFNANKGTDQTQEMKDEGDEHFKNPYCPASKDGEMNEPNAVKNVDGIKDEGHPHKKKQGEDTQGDDEENFEISPEIIELISKRCKVSIKEAEIYAKQIEDENNISEMTQEEIINKAGDIDAENYDPRAVSRNRTKEV